MSFYKNIELVDRSGGRQLRTRLPRELSVKKLLRSEVILNCEGTEGTTCRSIHLEEKERLMLEEPCTEEKPFG